MRLTSRGNPANGGSLPGPPPANGRGKRQEARKPSLNGRGLARNSVLNIAGLALPLAVGILTIPPTIRGLGADRFGILSLAWVIVGYFGFLDLGLGRSTTKFAAEMIGRGRSEEVPRILWASILAQIGLGLLAALLLAGLTPLFVDRFLRIPIELRAEAKAAFYWLAVSMPFVLVTASLRGLLEAMQRFDLANLVKIPSSAANYVLPLVGLLLGFKLPGILILIVAFRALSAAAWAAACGRCLPGLFRTPGLDRATLRRLLGFGGWVTVTSFLAPLLVYLERFFIASRLGMGPVSVYVPSYELVSRLGVLPAGLMITLFPAFSSLNGSAEKERSDLLYWRSIKFVTLTSGALAALVFFFADDILRLWLGGTLGAGGALVMRILAAGFLFSSMAIVPFSLVQGIGRADITAKIHVLEVLVYAPLCWVLVGTWGIGGAAAAWTIRVGLDAGILLWASGRFGRVSSAGVRAERPALALGLVLAFGAAGLAIKPLWGLAGLAGLTVIFAASAWGLGLRPDERRWVLGLCRLRSEAGRGAELP